MGKMGTYYALGVIHKIKATSNQSLTNEEWVRKLNERFDVNLFDLKIEEEASLLADIFSENIMGFY